MFNRFYRLKIHTVSQSCWYFRSSFVNYCHSNLLSGYLLPPTPFPCVNKYTVYTYTVCKGGGEYGVIGGRGPLTDKTPVAKFNFFDNIWQCFLSVESFYGIVVICHSFCIYCSYIHPFIQYYSHTISSAQSFMPA